MSLRFRRLINISLKGAELRHMVLLNINRNPYMGSPTTPSHLALNNLEREKSRSFRFRKTTELHHMLLLNVNRKTCIGSPLVRLYLT